MEITLHPLHRSQCANRGTGFQLQSSPETPVLLQLDQIQDQVSRVLLDDANETMNHPETENKDVFAGLSDIEKSGFLIQAVFLRIGIFCVFNVENIVYYGLWKSKTLAHYLPAPKKR